MLCSVNTHHPDFTYHEHQKYKSPDCFLNRVCFFAAEGYGSRHKSKDGDEHTRTEGPVKTVPYFMEHSIPPPIDHHCRVGHLRSISFRISSAQAADKAPVNAESSI